MPVVLTDKTNMVWCVEQPDDGFLHVGTTGKPGPRLLDVLDFIEKRQKQFDNFVNKKRKKEDEANRRLRRTRTSTFVSKGGRSDGTGQV